MMRRENTVMVHLTIIGAWWSGPCGRGRMGHTRGETLPQRTAIQGSPAMITAVTNVYQVNAPGKDPGKHPFKKYFEELQIGDQIITEKRTITSDDIDRFADLAGSFYAHIKKRISVAPCLKSRWPWISYHEYSRLL